MQSFKFETPLVTAIKKAGEKERARFQSDSADSGIFSAPPTPQKFSTADTFVYAKSGNEEESKLSTPEDNVDLENPATGLVTGELSENFQNAAVGLVIVDLSENSVAGQFKSEFPKISPTFNTGRKYIKRCSVKLPENAQNSVTVFAAELPKNSENTDAGRFNAELPENLENSDTGNFTVELPESPFVPLDRELTSLENYYIFRLAQRLADHQMKFGVPKIEDFSAARKVAKDDPYSRVVRESDGVLGASSRGMPSAFSFLPPKQQHQRRNRKNSANFCTFCKNNEMLRSEADEDYVVDEEIWQSHRIKDENGHCTCPVLRKHVCEYCGLSGNQAHTIRYCTKKYEDFFAKSKNKRR